LVEEEYLYDVTAALDILPRSFYPAPIGDPYIANLPAACTRVLDVASSSEKFSIAAVSLLPPLANPSKIIAAPINFQSHIDFDLLGSDIAHSHKISHITEAGLFLKATSSLAGVGNGFVIQFPARRNDFELELVVVIGTQCHDVEESRALEVVAGYSIGLDMTVRGPEDRSFRKSHDGYSIVGPFLVTADEVECPDSLDMLLTINGEIRQSANTKDMVCGVRRLISMASKAYTLYPSDMIFCGTPDGVGEVVEGDHLACSISKLGALSIAVKSKPA
jgi:2,4-didehydro-3-deoxy-L-rhamnonate hydrolase